MSTAAPLRFRSGASSGEADAGMAAAAPVYPWVVRISRWDRDAADLVDLVRRATAREEPFSLMVVLDRAAEREEASSRDLDWIRLNRCSVGVWCRGVAYVVSAPTEPRTVRRRFGGSPFVWGCRVVVTNTVTEALSWLDDPAGATSVPAAR